jgi:maleate isomerase
MHGDPTVIPMFPDHEQRGLGVVAPFDFALDRELWRWMPPEASLYVTRLGAFGTTVTLGMVESLTDAEALGRATADLLVPEPLAVAFACSSASFVHGVAGERRLVDTMLAAGASAAITASGALALALRRVGAETVAVATPYLDSVTQRLHGFLDEHGITVVSSSSLGWSERIWSMSYVDVYEAALQVDHPDADAVFIGCTNVRSYDIIAPLEARLGKPVLTANQVTMWNLLELADLRLEVTDQALFAAHPWPTTQGTLPDSAPAVS